MKILAFLQNPWFRKGTSQHHIEMYRDNQDFHHRVLSLSMTGKRLVRAFGELYPLIHWDNTNWRPSSQASGREESDYTHMMTVLARILPDIVLAFGNQAIEACHYIKSHDMMPEHIIILNCHHPNARHRTQEHLNQFAELVRKYSCTQTIRP